MGGTEYHKVTCEVGPNGAINMRMQTVCSDNKCKKCGYNQLVAPDTCVTVYDEEMKSVISSKIAFSTCCGQFGKNDCQAAKECSWKSGRCKLSATPVILSTATDGNEKDGGGDFCTFCQENGCEADPSCPFHVPCRLPN